MQQASIKTEIPSKREEKETTLADPQSVQRREGGNLIKEKTIKVNLMHKHFIHTKSSHGIHTLHQIYVFLFERRMQREKGSCT